MTAIHHYVLLAMALVGLSAVIAWAMAGWRVLVDMPNERSSHVRPTPRGGGVGILAAFMLGLLALEMGGAIAPPARPLALGFAAGGLIMGLAGLADDVRSLSFLPKLAAQAAAAAAAMAAGLVVEVVRVPGLGPVELGAAGYLVTLVWLVGLTNAYNFMDGLDGLAGATGLLAAVFLALAALTLGQHAVAACALILACACAGFLPFNWPPARIFMGDAGSQLLGFAFAALGVWLAAGDTTGTAIYVVPLLLFHFLFDTVMTAARRTLRGENPTAAHRSHLYQRLNQAGLSHARVSLLLAAMAAAQGTAALWLANAPADRRALAFAPALALQLGYAALATWLHRRAR